MSDRMIIFHANCVDGFTSAWVAHKRFGRRDTDEYVPAKYGDDPPSVKGKKVLILDFSYPRDVLLRMKEEADELIVLDHHKTAEEDLKGLDFCQFDMDRSGCAMTWDYLFPEYKERPWIVNYAQDRDLWHWRLPSSEHVNALLQVYPKDFASWDALNEMDLSEAKKTGEAINMARSGYINLMKEHARIIQFEGYEGVPCVNAPFYSISELLHILASDHVSNPIEGGEGVRFSLGWFQRGDGKFQYSLRSKGEFDVSEIAKRFGGGGHKNAAGFVSDTIIHNTSEAGKA